MRVVGTFEEVRQLRAGIVGLVPTMGFFHEGHLALMSAARTQSDTVVVSLFVNPLQFGADEDLGAYPRDLDRDVALAVDAGVDVLFTPTLEYMYPEPLQTEVSLPALFAIGEGRARPGHFLGVATVVAKLFSGILPDRAYMGRKDAQQLVVVRRMAADLSMPVEVVGMPIVRELDGLALSSRNVYLSPPERTRAAMLSAALFAAAAAAERGEVRGPHLEGVVHDRLEEAGVTAEYVELTDATAVSRLDTLDRDAFLAVAAAVGPARLIDNVWLSVDGPTVTADRGVLLDELSVLGG